MSRAKKQLDRSSVAGFAIAIIGVVGGLFLEGGRLSDVTQLTAAFIVLGGTAGAVLVTTPTRQIETALKSVPSLFWQNADREREILSQIAAWASEARRSGAPALEQKTAAISDRFLRKALALAVDGVDSKTIRDIMEHEVLAAERRTEANIAVFENAGAYAPTIGILGAVLGLIQVMKHLDNLHAVGHGIAVAFVATVYGVSLANLVLYPAAGKLRARFAAQLNRYQLIIEGIAAIAESMNPFLIQSKLESFVEDHDVAAVNRSKPARRAVQTA